VVRNDILSRCLAYFGTTQNQRIKRNNWPARTTRSPWLSRVLAACSNRAYFPEIHAAITSVLRIVG
jgi:hypothetical protein